MKDGHDTSSGEDIVYDWNSPSSPGAPSAPEVVDETLRDGLQGGVPMYPQLEQRLSLLRLVEGLGVKEAVVGFPADDVAFRQVSALARRVAEQEIALRLGLLGRMCDADVEAIDRIREEARVDVTAWLFLGSSRIRRNAQGWSEDRLLQIAEETLARAHALGLPVNLGIEDAARAEPEMLDALLEIAMHAGVETVTVCDTVGCLTPTGCEHLVAHARERATAFGSDVRIDFHGHDDRGLALANSLAALGAGADRVHATALGIGERSGNAPLELLIVNLLLAGQWHDDASGLSAYCAAFADACGLEIPDKYPVFGKDAFCTRAGVHAAAILKANERYGPDISNLVYSAVDPRVFGRRVRIEVGPTSGHANVRHVLRTARLDVPDHIVSRILRGIRTNQDQLTAEEVCAIARRELKERR